MYLGSKFKLYHLIFIVFLNFGIANLVTAKESISLREALDKAELSNPILKAQSEHLKVARVCITSALEV
jgi:hypothetical protein